MTSLNNTHFVAIRFNVDVPQIGIAAGSEILESIALQDTVNSHMRDAYRLTPDEFEVLVGEYCTTCYHPRSCLQCQYKGSACGREHCIGR